MPVVQPDRLSGRAGQCGSQFDASTQPEVVLQCAAGIVRHSPMMLSSKETSSQVTE